MSQSTDNFSQLAAETFLSRLESQRFRSHNKHIIDYLPERERQGLFDGLMERADIRKSVYLGKKRGTETLAFVAHDDFELLVFLVVDDEELDQAQEQWGRNAGTDGFASRLRDFYYYVDEGRQAACTRLLVTLTPGGNETQKSAQDSAVDHELLSLRVLCDRLAQQHDLADDEHASEIIDTYLAYAGRERWEDVLDRLATFLDSVATLDPAKWGEHLPKLGHFLSDSSPEYVSGQPFSLPRTAQSHRAGPNTRLHNNAALRGYLENVFEDPLTDSDEAIGETFDDDSAQSIRKHGPNALDEVDVSKLERRTGTSKAKNQFDWSAVETDGASAYHKLAGADDDRILLVTGQQAFTVTVPLARPFDDEREHAHLFTWNDSKSRPRSVEGAAKVEHGDRAITFEIEADEPFTVLRVAISGGPKSYKRLHDEFHLVVYNASATSVAWDVGLELSLEHQAWVRDGRTASIRVLSSEGETVDEDFEYGSDDKVLAEEPDSVELEELVDSVRRHWVHGGKLPINICWVEGLKDKKGDIHDLVEELPFKGTRTDKKEMLAAFNRTLSKRREHASYLTSLTNVSRDASGDWSVEVARERLVSIRAWNEFGQEEAAGRVLREPSIRIVQRVEQTLSTTPYSPVFTERFDDYVAARNAAFNALAQNAVGHVDTSDAEQPEYVSVLLTNLRAHRDEIIRYYRAWLDACASVIQEKQSYGLEHESLLQTDLLVQKSEDGTIARLTVLPTHPWMLRALLSYQEVMNRAFTEASSYKDLASLITHDELQQLVPERIVEDWYLGNRRFRAENATPFHLEFLPEDEFEEHANLDYVERVVRNKIQRYLEMHRHLRNARRTLRIGFVNPGDARPLFEGLRDWIKRKKPRGKEEFDDFLETVPKIELLLFRDAQSASTTTGAAFDTFFRENLESPSTNDVDQVMLSKVRYGKRAKPGPDSAEDFVHICFAHALVDRSQSNAVDGDLDQGWDGCFAGGLMATSLRNTSTDAHDNPVSERGLWVGPVEDEQRRGIAAMLTLNRAAKSQQVVPGTAVYWRVTLPSLHELQPMYDNSDWVVHLDRELGLNTFRDFGSGAPTIIEYSDQEDPKSPGFDIITVTKHARPYIDQMSSVLDIADLEAADDNPHDAQRSMEKLLDDINILSGSWALDFLMGNIAQTRYSNRLKGNVGSALTFRWLRRTEEQELAERFGPQVVPVYVSLEEIIRATPASGLKTSEGLVRRYSNEDSSSEEAAKWCDDMLVLYLTPADAGRPYRIFGRIIEVKFGRSATNYATKGVEQVRSTHKLLQQHLSGGNNSLEAPFRHRQLSLLIKSQLEQALSANLITPKQYRELNLPTLSAFLASGKYDIDYVMAADSQQLLGDVFILSTSTEDDELVPKVAIDNGVRVMTFGLDSLRQLAFTEDTAPTRTGDYVDTLPRLGRIGQGLSDLLEGGTVHVDKTGLSSGDSEAGYDFSESLVEPSDVLDDDSNEPETPDRESSNTKTESTDMASVQLLVDWRGDETKELEKFLQQIVQSEMSWEEYSARMAEYTGREMAPNGKNWSRDRILEFFRDYGFIQQDDGVTYLQEEERAALAKELPEGGTSNTGANTARVKSPPKRTLSESEKEPLKQIEPDTSRLLQVIDYLGSVFEGHGIELEAPPSIEELEYGPRLLRVYVRLSPSETINSVRKRSEDIARMVGTNTSDIHIMNAPERRAVALDLPIEQMGYTVTFDDLRSHDSFSAAGYELDLGFCAGVHVTGTPHWVDLAGMPHALVAGTTGSGKTVFLRSIILTWLLTHSPHELDLRLSSSKPMDFNIFTQLPHAARRAMAKSPSDTLHLVRELVDEMDRRISRFSEAYCDNLKQYNEDPEVDEKLPRIVAVIDEYAETVLSFDSSDDRKAFESAVGRLAQKARAAGIHLVLCMQRPDSKVIQGAVKSNILHRFALKLPQNHDSRVILDEPGAEALLGKGDMLYKDASSKVHRLQVPFLDSRTLKRIVGELR